MPDWRVSKKANLLNTVDSYEDREENDFYATDPNSLRVFLDRLKKDNIELDSTIWENAVGSGALADVLKEYGYIVASSDIVDRGYPGTIIQDFLKLNDEFTWNGDILTNPPYKYALEFIQKSLQVITEGHKVVMFLKLTFLEGKGRKQFYLDNPPKYIYVFSERQTCYINGDFSEKKGSTVCYCWYIWEKGFKGEPIIRWL